MTENLMKACLKTADEVNAAVVYSAKLGVSVHRGVFTVPEYGGGRCPGLMYYNYAKMSPASIGGVAPI